MGYRQDRSPAGLRPAKKTVCGTDPEFFELAGLAPGPGDQVVQLFSVEPGVGVGLARKVRQPVALPSTPSRSIWLPLWLPRIR